MEDKPNFDKLAMDETPNYHAEIFYKKACEHIWDNYVLPLQKELEELKKENKELILEKQVANTGLDILHSENKSLKEQLIDLGNQL